MNVIKAVLANNPAPRRHNSSRIKETNTQHRNFQLALDGEPEIADVVFYLYHTNLTSKSACLLKYNVFSKLLHKPKYFTLMPYI